METTKKNKLNMKKYLSISGILAVCAAGIMSVSCKTAQNAEEPAAAPQASDPILRIEYSALSRHTSKLLLMIHSGYMNAPVTLAGFAEGLHMNSRYLGRVFLQETGMKFSEYLLAYRMEEAKGLIISTQDKISAIASMVGYPQTNRFYVHFRKYFGISPNAMRRFDARTRENSPRNGS